MIIYKRFTQAELETLIQPRDRDGPAPQTDLQGDHVSDVIDQVKLTKRQVGQHMNASRALEGSS